MAFRHFLDKAEWCIPLLFAAFRHFPLYRLFQDPACVWHGHSHKVFRNASLEIFLGTLASDIRFWLSISGDLSQTLTYFNVLPGLIWKAQYQICVILLVEKSWNLNSNIYLCMLPILWSFYQQLRHFYCRANWYVFDAGWKAQCESCFLQRHQQKPLFCYSASD